MREHDFFPGLYLALLLKEIGVPVLFVLNLMDAAANKGLEFDVDQLSSLLDAPVVPTIAIKGEGLKNLKDRIVEIASRNDPIKGGRIEYNREVERKIKELMPILGKDMFLEEKYNLDWLAIKLLEKDQECLGILNGSSASDEASLYLEKHYGMEGEIIMAEARYEVISKIVKIVLNRAGNRITLTDMLDKVFLNKFLGIPIFFVLVWATFQFTFTVAEPLMVLIEGGLEALGELITTTISMVPWVESFWVDAVLGGFGSIVVFLPNIFLLYFALSLLEDSGYLSRAAFVMDRAMYSLGLHGRSFIPMLIGFGCNIPGIMACRTIENEKDRNVAILINPFMSCGARLPVYVLFVAIIWPTAGTGIVFSLYVIGIAVAILFAVILKKTIFKGKPAPFLMEMSEYHPPTARNTLLHMWNKGKDFLKKAGIFIFTAVVIIWFLSQFGIGPGGEFGFLAEEDLMYSFLATFGQLIQPLFALHGYTWEWVVALFTGFIAKEIVVGTVATLFPAAGALEAAVTGLGPIVTFSYMLFVLLYLPCVATLPVMKRELNSWKLLLFSIFISLAIPYALSLLVSLLRFVV